MRAFRMGWLVVVLGLAACGGDSIKSPTFTPQLVSLAIEGAPATAPIGRPVPLTTVGQFTAPPGSASDTFGQEVEALCEVTPAQIARIDEGCVFVGLAIGTATVTANLDGLSSPPVVIEVTAPVLEQIVVEPAAATIALGTTQDFTARGIFTDSEEPRGIATPIVWASNDPGVATVGPGTGPNNTVSPVATGIATISATTTNEEGLEVSGSADLTVVAATLDSLLRVEPQNALVQQGLSRQFIAVGAFSDGGEQPVANSDIDWTSSALAVATINADGLATGVALGQTQIAATLKPDLMVTGNRSANATLTVTDDVCTGPFLASAGATAVGEVNGLCLLCSVTDTAGVIDADPQTTGVISVPVGLLGGAASLTATAADGTTFPGGSPAGFIVRRPAGLLLTAELLSQLDLQTLLDGNERETSSDSIPLRVTLLGLLGDDEAALVSFTPTQSFDALRLTLNSGVASALTTTEVSSACALAVESGDTP